jgi:hypothetical protein
MLLYFQILGLFSVGVALWILFAAITEYKDKKATTA